MIKKPTKRHSRRPGERVHSDMRSQRHVSLIPLMKPRIRTLYHGTSPSASQKIKVGRRLKSAKTLDYEIFKGEPGESDLVWFTTDKEIARFHTKHHKEKTPGSIVEVRVFYENTLALDKPIGSELAKKINERQSSDPAFWRMSYAPITPETIGRDALWAIHKGTIGKGNSPRNYQGDPVYFGEIAKRLGYDSLSDYNGRDIAVLDTQKIELISVTDLNEIKMCC